MGFMGFGLKFLCLIGFGFKGFVFKGFGLKGFGLKGFGLLCFGFIFLKFLFGMNGKFFLNENGFFLLLKLFGFLILLNESLLMFFIGNSFFVFLIGLMLEVGLKNGVGFGKIWILGVKKFLFGDIFFCWILKLLEFFFEIGGDGFIKWEEKLLKLFFIIFFLFCEKIIVL